MRIISLITLLAPLCGALKPPSIRKTEFEAPLKKLIYFDDLPTILSLHGLKVFQLNDDGALWLDITQSQLKDADVAVLHGDAFHEERVFVLTRGTRQFFSTDKGKTWRSFEMDQPVEQFQKLVVSQSRASKDKVLVNRVDCKDIFDCTHTYYYTKDEFSSGKAVKLPVENPVYCAFVGSSSSPDDILCVKNNLDSSGKLKLTDVIHSSDYFATLTTLKDDGLSEATVYDLEVLEHFTVLKTYLDRFSLDSYVDLYVARDGKLFRKSHFPGDLKSESFVLLPSTENLIYVLVWGVKRKVDLGILNIILDLYVLELDGMAFRKLDSGLAKDQEFFGFHSIEKISNLNGVWLGNIMAGFGSSIFFPKVQSRMSFDDGRSWSYLKYKIPDNKSTKVYCDDVNSCTLNLLNAIEMTGDGHFESGPTPGILFGIGAVLESLIYDHDRLLTWVLTDGGASWTVAIDFPCVFSIGDHGNIVVAVPYYEPNDKSNRKKVYWSVDQGSVWQETELEDPILPTVLTTTIDGLSQKFVFGGFNRDGRSDDSDVVRNGKFEIFSLDFSDVLGSCSKGDMEEFKTSTCIMGQKEVFLRRKKDASCFVKKLYEDVAPVKSEPCECSESDYECSRGFSPDGEGVCQPDLHVLRQMCAQNPGMKKSVKAKTKITADKCKGPEYSGDDHEINCDDILKNLALADIVVLRNAIPSKLLQYVYLTQSKTNVDDETVLLVTSNGRLYILHNGGMEFFWASVDGDDVVAVMENRYNGDNIVVITPTNKMFYSKDRARSFIPVTLPSPINVEGYVPFIFHPNLTEKLIFIGSTEECSKSRTSSGCRTVTYITSDSGETWTKMVENARLCDFSGARFETDDLLILCELVNPDRSVKIASLTLNFDKFDVHFEHAVGIAPDDTFLVVADIVSEDNSLKLYTTIDGINWAHAKFPHDLHVGTEQAYTIINLNLKLIYLHVTTNNNKGQEVGAILKLNLNGTLYVLLEELVNRDTPGFVDFEKIEGLEGVSVVNVVANMAEVGKGEPKQLKTKITHNDGAEWAYLAPPSVDSQGKKYSCSGKLFKDCSLNLHGFTERIDYRDTYSSGSGVGMMIGVGNVGPYLLPYDKLATFMTRDGGITWKEIHSKPMGWEFGDQGSVIVLVDQENPTKELFYSLDEGDNWSSFEFHPSEVRVTDIATIPLDTLRRFVLFTSAGADDANRDKYSLAIGVDFLGVFARQCKLDLDNLDVLLDDYEFWTPKHPFLADDCLFGHEARYLRRKPSRLDCFVGSAPLNEGYRIVRNCSCTRRDYECDYNFARVSDGTCKLVPGLQPKDPKEMCVNDKVFEYYAPTGYRKLPTSTCQGGQELDKYEPKPCPGKELEYNKEHGTGISGFNLFIVIFVPVLAFVFALWFVYDKGIRRNGGFARLGQIRLEDGDEGLGFPTRVENTFTDKIVNRVVDFGVFAFMSSVGLILALNRVRKDIAAGRNPLRRGNLSYALLGSQVYLDEDELLGAEEDGDDDGDVFVAGDEFDDDAHSIQSSEARLGE